jgi:hypothetical protein
MCVIFFKTLVGAYRSELAAKAFHFMHIHKFSEFFNDDDPGLKFSIFFVRTMNDDLPVVRISLDTVQS